MSRLLINGYQTSPTSVMTTGGFFSFQWDYNMSSNTGQIIRFDIIFHELKDQVLLYNTFDTTGFRIELIGDQLHFSPYGTAGNIATTVAPGVGYSIYFYYRDVSDSIHIGLHGSPTLYYVQSGPIPAPGLHNYKMAIDNGNLSKIFIQDNTDGIAVPILTMDLNGSIDPIVGFLTDSSNGPWTTQNKIDV